MVTLLSCFIHFHIEFESNALILIANTLVACGATAKGITRMSRSERTDVFTEVSGEGPLPEGYADIVIRASLKTQLEGYYPIEAKRSSSGKPEYPFLLNIDGQAALWKVKGLIHQLPENVNGKTNPDPEAGEGMRYMLEKKVRVAAGAHKVFFGLPGEPYHATTELRTESGESYILEFKPQYRHKTIPTRIPTSLRGIDNYEVMFTIQKR